jgi:hypothetical protein
MVFLLGAVAFWYVVLAAGCAFYLLLQAYHRPPGTAFSDFEKLGLAALIAVVGTGFTAMAAIYGATRQATTAYQVQLLSSDTSRTLAQYNAAISTKLTEMKNDSDTALAKLKTNSDEALARLKVGLDAAQLAYRELFGVATVYFYALRSAGQGQWSDDALKTAETGMISGTPHLLYVNANMRTWWYHFWQRAQAIRREAATKPETERPEIVATLIETKVDVDKSKINLRDLHHKLEEIARSETSAALAGSRSEPTKVA